MDENKVRKMVRLGYGKIAKTDNSDCCGCGSLKNISEKIGYSKNELDSVPKGANLNLGCGNPVALANLNSGETVVDLGSGGGLDCFLASKKVGSKGKVIGIDMTPEMLETARQNCIKGKYANVEFRLGEIENLPVADKTANVVISNCVINLSTKKSRVFKEVFRILKPNGRLIISDMVLLEDIPKPVRNNVAVYTGCIGGAEIKNRYLETIKKAGFINIEVMEQTKIPYEALVTEDTLNQIVEELRTTKREVIKILQSAVSIKVLATKPSKNQNREVL